MRIWRCAIFPQICKDFVRPDLEVAGLALLRTPHRPVEDEAVALDVRPLDEHADLDRGAGLKIRNPDAVEI